MKADEIRTVAVIGAGTMGAGMAGEFARAGCAVRLVDRSDEILGHALGMVKMAQEALIAAGRITARKAALALKRIEMTTALEQACEGVQLLVEAVPEKLLLKQEMFARFHHLCPKTAILATNTSGLSITQIAGAAKRPARVAGMHFWNPPHIIPLVEVIKGQKTSAATANTLLDFCRRIGKQAILVRRDVPGFVGNRLQFAVMREALHILSEGIASAEDIDTAMRAGPGLRWGVIGPLRTADLGGLDIFHAISEYLFPELNSDSKPSPFLSQLVREGRLGAKSGMGFYQYRAKQFDEFIRHRDDVLLRLLKVLNEKESVNGGMK